MKLKLKRLTDTATMPSYAHDSDAGMDVSADADMTIAPSECVAVPTGFSIELPDGYEAQMRPRSGIALKHSVTLTNSPGTVDSGYRGEIKVIMINHGKSDFVIKRGDRIAQMVIAPVIRAEIETVDRLSDSDRGEGGFGSTGVGKTN